jgi:uncharacterized protein DUF1236
MLASSCIGIELLTERAMRLTVLLVAASVLIAGAGGARAQPTSAEARALTLEQKTRISQLITEQTAPLSTSSFSIAIDSVVPPEIEIHPLPSAAEQVAPRLHGLGYIVIEELIALVDPGSRKVALVFPRWRAP